MRYDMMVDVAVNSKKMILKMSMIVKSVEQ